MLKFFIAIPPYTLKALVRQALLVASLAGATAPAFALPFNPGTTSIQNYLNTLRWADGSRVIFQNVATCKINDTETMAQALDCREGFVTITNPMGTQVCSLTSVTYTKTSIVGGDVEYKTGSCRYKNRGWH